MSFIESDRFPITIFFTEEMILLNTELGARWNIYNTSSFNCPCLKIVWKVFTCTFCYSTIGIVYKEFGIPTGSHSMIPPLHKQVSIPSEPEPTPETTGGSNSGGDR